MNPIHFVFAHTSRSFVRAYATEHRTISFDPYKRRINAIRKRRELKKERVVCDGLDCGPTYRDVWVDEINTNSRVRL